MSQQKKSFTRFTDIDFVTFHAEFKALTKSFPKYPSAQLNNQASDFGDYIINCKNVYYGFDAVACEDSMYQYDAYKNKSCVDCSFTAESELCHECVGSFQCYRCTHLVACGQSRDCAYCYLCEDCQDCFGSAHLISQKFVFFNKQLTESEYRTQVAAYTATKTPRQIWDDVEALKKTFPRHPQFEFANENSPYGDYSYRNSNSYYVFEGSGNVDSGYLFDSHRIKSSFDQTYSVENELCYELTDCVNCYGSGWSKDLVRCMNCFFSVELVNCSDCLGCIYLSNQQYCILNTQYTKEEYEKLKAKIIATAPSAIYLK